ncbi:hypothetical protein GJ496_009302 [Pomphorhynchus laevis]|nr:hypothetical protein GJ496_009302 [Pomphorhynchus laevis]
MLPSDDASSNSPADCSVIKECLSNETVTTSATTQDSPVEPSFPVDRMNRLDESTTNVATIDLSVNNSGKFLRLSNIKQLNIYPDQTQQASIIPTLPYNNYALSSIHALRQEGFSAKPESLKCDMAYSTENNTLLSGTTDATIDTFDSRVNKSNKKTIVDYTASASSATNSYSLHSSTGKSTPTGIFPSLPLWVSTCTSNTTMIAPVDVQNSFQRICSPYKSIQQQRMMLNHDPIMQMPQSSNILLLETPQMSCQRQQKPQQRFPHQYYFNQQLSREQMNFPFTNQNKQSMCIVRSSLNSHPIRPLRLLLNIQNNSISSHEFKINGGVANTLHTSLPNAVSSPNHVVKENVASTTNTGTFLCENKSHVIGTVNPLGMTSTDQMYYQLRPYSSDSNNNHDIDINNAINHKITPTISPLGFDSNNYTSSQYGSAPVINQPCSTSGQSSVNSVYVSHCDPQFSKNAQAQPQATFSHQTSRYMNTCMQTKQQEYMHQHLSGCNQLHVNNSQLSSHHQQFAHPLISQVQQQQNHRPQQHHAIMQFVNLSCNGLTPDRPRLHSFQNIILKKPKSLLSPRQMDLLNLQLHAYRFLRRHASLPNDYLIAQDFLSASTKVSKSTGSHDVGHSSLVSEASAQQQNRCTVESIPANGIMSIVESNVMSDGNEYCSGFAASTMNQRSFESINQQQRAQYFIQTPRMYCPEATQQQRTVQLPPHLQYDESKRFQTSVSNQLKPQPSQLGGIICLPIISLMQQQSAMSTSPQLSMVQHSKIDSTRFVACNLPGIIQQPTNKILPAVGIQAIPYHSQMLQAVRVTAAQEPLQQHLSGSYLNNQNVLRMQQTQTSTSASLASLEYSQQHHTLIAPDVLKVVQLFTIGGINPQQYLQHHQSARIPYQQMYTLHLPRLPPHINLEQHKQMMTNFPVALYISHYNSNFIQQKEQQQAGTITTHTKSFLQSKADVVQQPLQHQLYSLIKYTVANDGGYLLFLINFSGSETLKNQLINLISHNSSQLHESKCMHQQHELHYHPNRHTQNHNLKGPSLMMTVFSNSIIPSLNMINTNRCPINRSPSEIVELYDPQLQTNNMRVSCTRQDGAVSPFNNTCATDHGMCSISRRIDSIKCTATDRSDSAEFNCSLTKQQQQPQNLSASNNDLLLSRSYGTYGINKHLDSTLNQLLINDLLI